MPRFEHSSEIDAAVQKILDDKSHQFGLVDMKEYCFRCGKLKIETILPDGTFTKCRGFIGGI